MSQKKHQTSQKLREQIKADANPEKLVAAIKRKDKSYIKGALQWYERSSKKELTQFLRSALLSC